MFGWRTLWKGTRILGRGERLARRLGGAWVAKRSEVDRARAAGRPVGFMAVARLGLGLFGLIVVGCQSAPPPSDWVIGASHTVTNVFRERPQLPATIRRVAVLPLAVTRSGWEMDTGRESLEPTLHAELGRCGVFEVVPVTRERARQWTGRVSWRADDRLHPELFEVLKSQLDIDAVLFAELTEYRPYPPVALGWKMRLVDVERRLTWWSVDEIFDGGAPDVANGARRYQHSKRSSSGPVSDSRVILSSPRAFAQYSLEQILATMPTR